jgi:hypothetical protein
MLLPVLFALAATLGPYTTSTNFATNLLGPVDTRPECWGNADTTSWPLTFTPPVGYRVRILKVHGDVVSWPMVLPGQAAPPANGFAGILLSLHNTGATGSVHCDGCSDNAFLYVQDAVRKDPVRTALNASVREGGLLGPDNKMIVKVAAWLNTTGYPIHIEPTFTITFRYEKIDR